LLADSDSETMPRGMKTRRYDHRSTSGSLPGVSSPVPPRSPLTSDCLGTSAPESARNRRSRRASSRAPAQRAEFGEDCRSIRRLPARSLRRADHRICDMTGRFIVERKTVDRLFLVLVPVPFALTCKPEDRRDERPRGVVERSNWSAGCRARGLRHQQHPGRPNAHYRSHRLGRSPTVVASHPGRLQLPGQRAPKLCWQCHHRRHVAPAGRRCMAGRGGNGLPPFDVGVFRHRISISTRVRTALRPLSLRPAAALRARRRAEATSRAGVALVRGDVVLEGSARSIPACPTIRDFGVPSPLANRRLHHLGWRVEVRCRAPLGLDVRVDKLGLGMGHPDRLRQFGRRRFMVQ